jgi:hypothetical protein
VLCAVDEVFDAETESVETVAVWVELVFMTDEVAVEVAVEGATVGVAVWSSPWTLMIV